MKITRVECIPVSIPFAKPIVMSGASATVAAGLVLKIHTDEGVTGVAETGDTSLWYMGETQDSILSNIAKVYAPNILLGEDPFNLETIVAKMDAVTRANNHSKAVVDYALHDLMGKALGIPTYKLLGGMSNPKIPLVYVMSFGTPESVAAEARVRSEAGFPGVKLKVGAKDPETDIDTVAAVRETVGSKVKVMIDANGAWMYHQALYVLQRVAKYEVFLCEQPVPWWDIEGLARLRKKVEVPIFADESASELGSLLQILKMEAADGFFLKVPKAGGILKSRRWVDIAKAANMPVMCGCMVNSGLGCAAEAAFLGATEWMGRIEQESIGPLNLHDLNDTVSGPIPNDLAITPVRYERGYLYPPTDGVGLGVELNEDTLARLAASGKPAVDVSA